MPYSLEEVYQRIPEAKVENYRREAVAATIAHVREYLPE